MSTKLGSRVVGKPKEERKRVKENRPGGSDHEIPNGPAHGKHSQIGGLLAMAF